MPSNEGHIHWAGAPSEDLTYLSQSLTIISEISNMVKTFVDPEGALRLRATSFSGSGLLLPSEGWQSIPGTNPTLEARMDGYYPTGYIRIRQA